MNRNEILQNLKTEYGVGKEITLDELSLMLRKVDGSKATNLWLIAETPVKMNVGGKKRENPLCDEKVMRISKYDATINFNYQNAVNNQLAREGEVKDFISQPNWHASTFDDFNGCVKNHVNGSGEYLAIKQNQCDRIAYLVNDNEANAEQLAAIDKYKKPYYAPQNQGTEKPIDYRTVTLSNILMIKMYGELYYISEN